MPSTGIEKLDDVLLNGVPHGYTILALGTPSSGLELFAKQFATGDSNSEVIYFSTTETEEEIKNLFNQYNWKPNIKIISIAKSYYEKILAKELEASKLKRVGLSKSDIRKMIDYEETKRVNFLEEMTYEVSKYKKDYRVIVDSLDFFLEQYSEEDVLSAIRTICAHVHFTKGLVLFTIVKDIHEKRIEGAISAIVDCVIELEVVKIGTEFENRLVVKKVKNMPQKIVTLIYSITETGITPETLTRIG